MELIAVAQASQLLLESQVSTEDMGRLMHLLRRIAGADRDSVEK